MKKFKQLLLIFLMAFAITSCYTNVHYVGDGAKGSRVESKKQWYALWGLVPINDVSSREMAGDATDYTIKTEHKFVDQLITIFTSFVTVTVMTVEVKK